MFIIHHIRCIGKFFAALQIGDGAANIQQHSFGEGAGGITQNGHNFIGGKIVNGCKIIRAVKPVGIVPTAGQHRICNAVAHQIPEADMQIQFVQFFQKTVLLCLSQLLQIVAQVVVCDISADFLHLLHKGRCIVGWWAIAVAEMFQHSHFMGWGHAPEAGNCDRLCSGSGVGIRDIKNISDFGCGTAIVNQGNAVGPAVDPPAHAPVPDVHGSAGCGVWPLGMNQQLIPKGIFINPGGSFQKLLPAAAYRGKLRNFLAAKLCNQL